MAPTITKTRARRVSESLPKCIKKAAKGLEVYMVGSAMVDFPVFHFPGDLDLFFPDPNDGNTFLDRLDRLAPKEEYEPPDKLEVLAYRGGTKFRLFNRTYNVFTTEGGLDLVELLRTFDLPLLKVGYNLDGSLECSLRGTYMPQYWWTIQAPVGEWENCPSVVWTRTKKLYERGCQISEDLRNYLLGHLSDPQDKYALHYMFENPKPNPIWEVMQEIMSHFDYNFVPCEDSWDNSGDFLLPRPGESDADFKRRLGGPNMEKGSYY